MIVFCQKKIQNHNGKGGRVGGWERRGGGREEAKGFEGSELRPNHTYVTDGLVGEGTISRGDVSAVGLHSRLGCGSACLDGFHTKSIVHAQSTYSQHTVNITVNIKKRGKKHRAH